MSEVLALQNLPKGHKRIPYSKNDASVKSRGTWRFFYTNSMIFTTSRSVLLLRQEECRHPPHHHQRRKNLRMIQELQCICWAKGIWAPMKRTLWKGPDSQQWSWRPTGKCKHSRKHRFMFTIWDFSWLCKYSMKRQPSSRLENSAKTTDIPMRGSAAKSHGWPKMGRQSLAESTIKYPLLFQDCESIQVAVHLQRRH